MAVWGRTNPYDDLSALMQGNSISQPEPLVCYAVCSATELAFSMLMLLEIDSETDPVSGGTDADWADEDERIASQGLLEEVSQWPA